MEAVGNALDVQAGTICRIVSFNIAGGDHVLSIDFEGRVLVGEDEKEVYRFPPDETSSMLCALEPLIRASGGAVIE